MHSLDKHFRSLTGGIFQRHGFAQADVLSHWPDIMGPELAKLCLPERIRWPQKGELGNHRGATLSVKAFAGEALSVQYAAPQMIEKLNSFLGHGAITKIKISPSYLVRKAKVRPQAVTEISTSLQQQLSTIRDDDLQLALLRLGTAMAYKSPVSPQAK